MLLAMSNSVQYGMRTVLLSSIGNIIGLFGVSVLAMAGVGALLKASASIFFILKVFGAAYLFYLGLRQWQSRTSIFMQLDADEQKTGPGRVRIFARALLLALTNPKTILFFSALFPQFLIPSNALLPQFLILTCTFMVISFVSLMVYGFSASFMKRRMLVPRHNIWFNKISGSIFMFFGMSMLAMRNTTK